jgi:hypothetical protein
MEIIKRILNLDQLNVLDIQYGNNLEEAKYEYKKLMTNLKEINYNIISSELMLTHRFDSYIPTHYGQSQLDYNIPHAKRILTEHKLYRKSVYSKFQYTAKPKLRKWTILSYKMHLAYEWAKQLLMDELVVNDPILSSKGKGYVGSEEWREEAEKLMNTAKIVVEITDPEEYGKDKKQTIDIYITLKTINGVEKNYHWLF